MARKRTTNTTAKKRIAERTSACQERFLAAFAESGHVGNSAIKAGIERTAIYRWRDNPDFEAKFEKARLTAVGVLEDEAHRRAVEGVDEPVYYKGDVCGVVRKYSDTLLIVLLKANAPEKYRERQEIQTNGTLELVVKWDGNRNEAGSTPAAAAP